MARPQGGWQQGGWKSSVAEASSRALQTFCLQEEAHLSVAPAPARACFSLREGNGLGRTWTSAPAECCWRCSGRSALTASPNREVFLLASVHPAPLALPAWTPWLGSLFLTLPTFQLTLVLLAVWGCQSCNFHTYQFCHCLSEHVIIRSNFSMLFNTLCRTQGDNQGKMVTTGGLFSDMYSRFLFYFASCFRGKDAGKQTLFSCSYLGMSLVFPC